MTARQDLVIREGASFSWTYDAGVSLDGYSARAAIKMAGAYINTAEAYLSSGADASGGTITLSGTMATLSMTAAQTDALADEIAWWFPNRAIDPVIRMMWDLELVAADGTVTRPVEGSVLVYRSVTG